MTDFILQVMLNIPFNIALSSLCVITYLVNYCILKLKTQYRGVKYQIFLVLLLPYFNILFLVFNCMVAVTNIKGYRVIKVRNSRREHVRA